MSHQEKQEIFDSVFPNKNFSEWLTEYGINGLVKKDLINYVFAACDLVQEEQQKRIYASLKNIETVKSILHEHESITNPENKIQ